jgi:pilus assembly protein CpaC
MIQSIRFYTLVITLALASALNVFSAVAQEAVPTTGPAIRLDAGKGLLLRLDRDADTIFVADPEIADVLVKTPRLVYLFGKVPGETSFYAVDKEQRVIANKPIVVKRDVARVKAAIDQMVPDGAVDVRAVDGTLVLSGHVDSPGEAEEARRMARPFVADDKQLINHISIDAPNQVNLRVRVVEVQHNVVKELGFNWEALGNIGNFALGLATGTSVVNQATGQAITRNPGVGGSTDSGIFRFNTPNVALNSVIDALDQNGLVNILAEPNLTAVSGETASFLAGGEFPVPVPQSGTGGGAPTITINYKQFGVALAFTPVILANGRISLRVRPEVSQISANGQVQINGFTIPALSTRRAETTIELGSGQAFAIGGLLQNNIADTVNKVPGLGELPVLGTLFRSTQFQRNETELVIVVTPYLVRPVSEKRIATPRDGYVPPNYADMVLGGRTERPSAPEGGPQPVGPNGDSIIGPTGFILQ